MKADDPVEAIKALKTMKKKFDDAYESKNTEEEMNIFNDKKMANLLSFIGG